MLLLYFILIAALALKSSLGKALRHNVVFLLLSPVHTDYQKGESTGIIVLHCVHLININDVRLSPSCPTVPPPALLCDKCDITDLAEQATSP